MTTQIKLTDTQRQVLEQAADHAGGCITWLPGHVKGGARTKVLDGLSKRTLITYNGRDWLLTDLGYDTLGHARPTPSPTDPDPAMEPAVAVAEAAWAQDPTNAKPRPRESSKQATVIQMLTRPEGATIAQICEVTGWQSHTVRGTFAGVLKKKRGVTLLSDKPKGGERVYRVAGSINGIAT